jgi:hypothetical protein
MYIVRYSIRISTGMECDVAWIEVEGIILQYLLYYICTNSGLIAIHFAPT